MNMNRRRYPKLSAPLLSVLAALLAPAAALDACSVPVSYYALMRWESSPHRVDAAPESIPGDANAMPGQAAAGGHLRAFFPNQEQPWWDSALAVAEPAAVAALCDSPARRELAHRLARADAGVWILLECGDAKKDDAAAELIAKRLALVAKTAQLPRASEGEPESDVIDPALPPRLVFTVLRLHHDDPIEASLRAQLLHLAPGLDHVTDPLAYLVFGRGRALPPMTGEDLNEGNIDMASLFLVSACSCEIKERNPGEDLLLTVDWPAAIRQAERDVQAAAAAPAKEPAP
jgi:hypothetical protein